MLNEGAEPQKGYKLYKLFIIFFISRIPQDTLCALMPI